MTPYLEGKNHSNDSKFLIRNLEGQKEMVHFERAEIKEQSTQILYPEKKKKPSLNKGEIKTLSNKREPRDFVASRPTLEKEPKEVLQTERK